jgi:hypothetical protein
MKKITTILIAMIFCSCATNFPSKLNNYKQLSDDEIKKIVSNYTLFTGLQKTIDNYKNNSKFDSSIWDLKLKSYNYRIENTVRLIKQGKGRTAINSILFSIKNEKDLLLRSNPDLKGKSFLYITRKQYKPDHHNTATFYPCYDDEYNDGYFTPGSSIKILTFDLNGFTSTKTIFSTKSGVIRDPEISYDGTTILFAMRKNKSTPYQIYTMDLDGKNINQLTATPDADNIDPVWLPDGSIVFSATREKKYIHCNRHISANLYRMNSDGSNIYRISMNTLFDDHPAVMPDGRILYSRWEYVDRNFGDAQGIWSCNPDGTDHKIIFGNNTTSPGGFIDGHIIPRTDKILCTLSSCHDRPWGAIGVIDYSDTVDGPQGIEFVYPPETAKLTGMKGTDYTPPLRYEGLHGFDNTMYLRKKFEDPYPLDNWNYICSGMTGLTEKTGLYLGNFGEFTTLIHSEKEGCFDPVEIRSRNKEPELQTARTFGNDKKGKIYLINAYEGTHLKGIDKNEIKFLRIVEATSKRTFIPQKQWEGQGRQSPGMGWHDFYAKKIIGTIPVEEDGSAFFELPSETFVYFQLLDNKGKMIQSMRSGTFVQPGETQGCIGCHENRTSSYTSYLSQTPQAMQKSPYKLNDNQFDGKSINFLQDIQPIFNKNCVTCHDFKDAEKGRLNLAGDKSLYFNASYTELWRNNIINAAGAGTAEIKEARSWGSSASKLIKTIENGHNGIKLTTDEIQKLQTWIDLNAPYYPDYTSAYPHNIAGRSPLNDGEIAELMILTGINFHAFGIGSYKRNKGPMISFDRPELSPCLKNLPSTSRNKVLNIIKKGAERLKNNPRCDMKGHKPSELDKFRLRRYEERKKIEEEYRKAIKDNTKLYDRDFYKN